MKKGIPLSIYQRIGEILVIFTKAVRKAQQENRRLGLPNVYCEDGRIFYQLSDGSITDKNSLIDNFPAKRYPVNSEKKAYF